MKKPILAICDFETGYAQNLYAYVNERESEDFQVMLFTEIDKLYEMVDKNTIHNLIISKEIIEEADKGRFDEVDTVLYLCREMSDDNGTDQIYKYKSVDSILKKFMDLCLCNESSGAKRINHKPLKIIGVYSPIKRCFQSTFCITLGQILAKKGKTMYLNFESFSGFDNSMADRNRKNLMDLVYFWECGGDNFLYRLGSIVDYIGELAYVPPVNSFINYSDINANEWIRFIKTFEDYTGYEYLILDLSENVAGLLDILRKCTVVYTITAKDRISQAKLAQYETLLNEYQYEDVMEKTSKLEVPKFQEIPDRMEMLSHSKLAEFIKGEINKISKELGIAYV